VFKNVDTHVLSEHVGAILSQHNIPCDPVVPHWVARKAEGSVRDALSALEQLMALADEQGISKDMAASVLGLAERVAGLQLAKAIVEKSPGKALRILQQSHQNQGDVVQLVSRAASYFSGALVAKSLRHSGAAGSDPLLLEGYLDLLKEEDVWVKETSKNVSAHVLSEFYKVLAGCALGELAHLADPLPWCQVCVLDAVSRGEWLSASQIVHHLQNPAVQNPDLQHQKARSSQEHHVQNSTHFNVPAPVQPALPVQMATPLVVRPSLDTFQDVLKILAQNNKTLAARLRHAQIAHFDHHQLIFSSTPENFFYTRMNDAEKHCFHQALHESGYPGIVVSGAGFTNDGSGPVKHTPVPKMSSEHFTNQSLADKQNSEAQKKMNEKIEALKSLDAVQQLLSLSSKIEFVDLNLNGDEAS